MREDGLVWRGIVDPSHLRREVVMASHRLADAAKVRDWSTVFGLLDDPDRRVDVNWWRPGGTAWFTVLHQAAWHGAPIDVVVELVARGALRSVTDSRGRTPYGVYLDRCATKDLAHKAGSMARELLKPPPSPMPTDQVRALDRHLAAVIDARISGVLFDDPRKALRYPPVGILHEVPGQQLWFPVPGMYGGFHIMLREDRLDVRSWCRVAGGSGQAHRVTDEGATLVDEGFV
ncbi:MAG: ankyrin repeat domain-containing protein [Mycobacterium sp.]